MQLSEQVGVWKELGLDWASAQAGIWVRELGRASRRMERARARLGEWVGWRLDKGTWSCR